MMRKHHPVEDIDDHDHRHIAAFDPRDQIIGQLGRRGDAAVAEQLQDQLAEQRVVGRADLDMRRGGEARAQVGQRDLPSRRRRVGDDQQRLAPRLGVVPGVEERLLVMLLGIVEQAAAGLADEDPAEQAAARLARAGDQSRHDRPERPAGQMIEGGAVARRRGGNPPPCRPPARRTAARSGPSPAFSAKSSNVLPPVTCDAPALGAAARPRARRRRRRSVTRIDRGAAEREAGGDRRSDAVDPADRHLGALDRAGVGRRDLDAEAGRGTDRDGEVVVLGDERVLSLLPLRAAAAAPAG